ncbi:methyl-accepting chemotaxis protein [Halovivax ruber XH-70]|uniref:Methyl-accepting chemotaxis protein n=1 Tax=Halovivax ruber (strain DSM 18193 / JCM 13892 / XH-70) TaxID=797302 RepID=L0I8B3_HALRX|nr:methyl-accepting chemotaxis protein [Halovivax ruber]AGB15805.1 methyl-accepting chemotaxis protein [Halovivax ruber XH-70]
MSKRLSASPIRALRSSFLRKLSLLFLLVLLLVAAVGGAIYLQTESSLQDSTEQEMTQSTTLQANTISEWVDRTREKTQYLSASGQVAGGDSAEIADYLRSEQQDSSASIAGIHYYDTGEQEVLTSTEASADGVNYRDADIEWALEGLALETPDQTRVTHPYLDPTTETNAVAFVSQVPENPDRAIVVIVDLESQVQQLERPTATDESFTHIVDSRGTVVMSHHAMDINTQNMGPENEYVAESEAVKRGIDGKSGYTEMEMAHGDHAEMAMGYAPIPGTDWVIMTHTPVDTAFALQDDITRSVLALVVLSMLSLGAVGVVIVRNTSRPITRLADRASELEAGNLEAELSSNRPDEIGQLYNAFDSMRASLRGQIQEAEEARQEAEEERSRTDRINTHLEAKADEYSSVMRACGEGDLSRRMDPESQNDAMTEIALEFNQMLSNLEETVERVSQFADEVAAASEEVTASTEEVHTASTQVTESVQEISDGAERQNESLQAVNGEMNELSTTTEEIASSSHTVADLAERTAKTGNEGRDVARSAIDGMNEIETESEGAVDAIESLEEEVAQIDELVEFITEVAEQTNMLALNANIEASRATQSNDGFSAVADQVKELSEDTQKAARDIEERIEEIEEETNYAAGEVRQTSERIARHRQAVEDTVDALEEIAEYASETSDGIQEISAATEQQAATTQEVVSMVDQAATISEETTTEAETVAAAAEEQTTAITEVSRSASDLSQQAAELSSKLDEFETGHHADQGSKSDDADEFSFAEHGETSSESDDEDEEPRTADVNDRER